MYLRLFSCSKGRGAERKWARGARWWRIRPLPRSPFHTINLPLLTAVSRKWLWRLNCIWGSFSTLYVFYLKGGLVKLWKCRLAVYPLRHLNLRGDVWSGSDLHSQYISLSMDFRINMRRLAYCFQGTAASVRMEQMTSCWWEFKK